MILFLQEIERRVIDGDNGDILTRLKMILIDRIESFVSLLVDDKVCNRQEKARTKKSHESNNEKKYDSRREENMLEISGELHTIALYQVSPFAAKISLFLSDMKITKFFFS